MSRSRGERWVTSRSPISIRPSVTSSSPAIIRSSVDLPQPDGPTRTRNSPLSIVRSTSSTARTPPLNSFVTCSSVICAIAVSLLAPSVGLDCAADYMAVSPCCKRSLKSFSEILCRSSKPPRQRLPPSPASRTCRSRRRRASLNGIKTNPETLAAGARGGRGGRLRPERRRSQPALAAHRADRVRDAGRREPRLHDHGRVDPAGRAQPRQPPDPALDRGRRRRRARLPRATCGSGTSTA